MKKSMKLVSIGEICTVDGESAVKLDPKYVSALTGLSGFDYVQVIWWFDGCDDSESRSKLIEKKPYKKGPDVLGIFATRSPMRPNPIALSAAYVTHIDYEKGIIYLGYTDANEGSPVLDIKPYTPSLDRVRDVNVPDWCAHFPKYLEDSGEFDWESEFNF